MLNLRVESKGDKLVVSGLVKLADAYPAGIDRSIERAAKGTHREASRFLNGPGAKASDVPAGGYPVPRRTSHLHNRLNFIGPKRSKAADGSVFTTGVHEALVFDSAIYSRTIHDGLGSSSRFGPRPFITDGFKAFWEEAGTVIGEEIDTAIKESGL